MDKKQAWVYDFETISNCFTACFKSKSTGERRQFVIWKEINQFEEFMQFIFNEVSGEIGYNCVKFDGQIQQKLIDNYNKLKDKDSDYITKFIHDYVQYIINLQNENKWLDYPEWKLSIKQLDLFLIHHFDNEAKRTSLKWIQFMIDWPDIREMNLEHHEKVETKEQLDELLYYNWNDVESTDAFHNITVGKTELSEYKGKNKVQLRIDIQEKFGDKSCMNWNDVKIGDELNFKNYQRRTGESKKEIIDRRIYRTEVNLRECIADYVSFKTEPFQRLLREIKSTTVTTKSPSFEKQITVGYTTHIIKLGGLHSNEKPRRIVPREDQLLRDADQGGQYPAALAKRGLHPEHLDPFWNVQIGSNMDIRDAMKPFAKTDKKAKSIVELYKLANNGGAFGKLGEPTSWQRDTKTLWSVTIGCQMEILMLVEELELNGISVVSSNTDGIVSLFTKDKEETYKTICAEWEKKIGAEKLGKLEFTDYKELIQTSVNDYIAIKVDGEVKKKGDFMTEFELHKNKSRRIIPMALEKHYVDKLDAEEFIKNHKNIYDFCCAVRAKGTDSLKLTDTRERTDTKLQKTVRYYVAKSNNMLVKVMKPLENKIPTYQIGLFGGVDDGTREHQIEAGHRITVFNQYEEREDYGINYDYYINKTKETIAKIKDFSI